MLRVKMSAAQTESMSLIAMCPQQVIKRRISMRNITLAICMLFILSICAFAQVSKSNPLGGEIKETLSTTDSKVFVEVELLKEEDAALSVPLTNVSKVEMTVINVTDKLPDGTSRTTSVNKLATNISDA